MSNKYTVHRRVNAPLEFQGLKGAYIFIAGGIIVAALFFFAILYICHVNGLICILICCGSAGGGVGWMIHLSHQYGIHGWTKRRSARKVPRALLCHSRTMFMTL